MNAQQAVGYWFFQYQADDEQGRELDRLESKGRLGWARWPFGVEVNVGDIAFLWRAAGSDTGLKGWAVVQEEQSPGKLPRRLIFAPLMLRERISRTEFAQVPELSDAPLIRQIQTGSQFRLSIEQAFGLTEFLRTRTLEAPPIDNETIIELIKRRVQRELKQLPSLVVALRDKERALELGYQGTVLSVQLEQRGLSAIRSPLADLIAQLNAARSSNADDAPMAGSPLDTACSRLTNDLQQIDRFSSAQSSSIGTEGAPSAKEAVQASRNDSPQTRKAIEPDEAISAQSLPAAPASPSAPSPQVSPSAAPTTPAQASPVAQENPPPPPKPLAPPDDPLFRLWEQKDFVGIGGAVNNLARYIAHEGLVPPRAVGVFGNWGSGKTFFLEALQSQIALLSAQSRDAVKEQRPTVYCSHVVQIEFNAWHYVESNLWASLAAHIFEKLYDELERRGRNSLGNANVDGLFQQFSAYRQAVEEQQRLEQIVGSLTRQRDRAARNKKRAERFIKGRVQALGAVVQSKLSKLAQEKLSDGQRKQLKGLLEATNIEELKRSATEARDLLREGQSAFSRVQLQIGWWGWPQYLLFAGAAVLVLFGAPLLVAALLAEKANAMTEIATVIGTYALAASVGFKSISNLGGQFMSGVRQVTELLDETQQLVEQQPDERLMRANKLLDANTDKLKLIDTQVNEQRDQLAKLADEVDPQRLGERMRTFLEQRAKDGGYEKHLGLVSLVRKDFESLTKLMQTYWANRKQPEPEVFAQVKDALGTIARAQVPFIERIVLYIDDLDRCPENKVVEVLQAVHLMLGLPLFVVVVAADVRWVGQSIRKVYGELVAHGTNARMKSFDEAASADDYLEKIFQIPYRIHPMEPETRRELLSGLLRERFLVAACANEQKSTPLILQQELVPKELSLYEQEQQTISDLYESVGDSPRRVRRFYDVYRLMRCGMEEGDVQLVMNERHYEVILALFAMLSGAPLSAPRVIEELFIRMHGDLGTLTPNLIDWLDVEFPRRADSVHDEEREIIQSAFEYIDAKSFPGIEPRRHLAALDSGSCPVQLS